MSHDVAALSLRGPDKARCGDGHAVLETGRGAGVAFVVCDGVGSHSHDWLASETACRVVTEVLTDVTGDGVADLVAAIEAAHREVRDLPGPAAGASTTIVLCCWNPATGRCGYVSIGDSRLYRVSGAQLTQLTEDDSASVPVKIAGELATSSGSVRFASGLTRALGHGALGPVEVETITLAEGEILAATTDGFHEIPGFQKALLAASSAADLERALTDELEPLHAAAGRDDATIVILRRGSVNEALLDRCRRRLAAGSGAAGLDDVPVHLLRQALWRLASESMREGEHGAASRALDLLEERGLQLAKQQLVELLDTIRDDRSAELLALYQRLVRLAGMAR
jgi:protein phosphatase